MTDVSPSTRHPELPVDKPPQSSGVIAVTRAEFFWLTFGVWVGGIFILTMMPVLLIPRIGMPLGVVGSYLLFFAVWQPVQTITQRTIGVRGGIIRMVIFVAAAATIAFYLRESLLDVAR